MTYVVDADNGLPPGIALVAGKIPGWSSVNKFGRNESVGTSYVALSEDGVYQTPQVAGAVALRIKAGNTNDTAAGSGAQAATLQGLDETGAQVTEVLATAGTSASSATTVTWLRLYRAWVSASGTYVAVTGASHAADIIIETAAGAEWAKIDGTTPGAGQTEIGCYTVPLGYKAYLTHVFMSVADANKPAEILCQLREGILDTSAPYSSRRTLLDLGGEEQQAALNLEEPIPIATLTDIIFLAKAATGTPSISVNFTVVLEAT